MAFGGGAGAEGIAQASDVALSNVTHNQALVYDTASSKWSNKDQSASQPHNHTVADITGLQTALDSKLTTASLYINGIINEGETPGAPGIYIVRPQ